MSDTKSAKKTIFTVGVAEYNLDLIRAIPGASDWELVPALKKKDVQPPHGRIDFDELYDKAKTIIEDHGGKPDAIIGDLDFPVTALVALLNRAYGLPGATPEAVARCEHKYWMRLIQEKTFPGEVPGFKPVNPFEPEKAAREGLDFPYWLKPVKGHSSVLGFMVEDEGDLNEALHACRQKIHLIGQPFNAFLDKLEDTGEIGDVDGNYAVAEELISAKDQFTLEGYVWQGEPKIYAAVESRRTGRHGSTFYCFQYPARLSDEVLERATEISKTMLKALDYDGSPFNIEFFHDPETGALHLLEIKARISKSHSPLFRMVDGVTQHKVAIDLALGREPDMPDGEGKDALAGKFILRSFEADGIVKRVPDAEEIAALERVLPDIDAKVLVEKDTRLSDLFYQESYSYELVDVFLGGSDQEMLEDAYRRAIDSLPVYIKPLPETQ